MQQQITRNAAKVRGPIATKIPTQQINHSQQQDADTIATPNTGHGIKRDMYHYLKDELHFINCYCLQVGRIHNMFIPKELLQIILQFYKVICQVCSLDSTHFFSHSRFSKVYVCDPVTGLKHVIKDKMHCFRMYIKKDCYHSAQIIKYGIIHKKKNRFYELHIQKNGQCRVAINMRTRHNGSVDSRDMQMAKNANFLCVVCNNHW